MTIDTDQLQLCVTKSHNLLLTLVFMRVVGLVWHCRPFYVLAIFGGAQKLRARKRVSNARLSQSVAISATANYTVWTPIVMTVAIRSHNCLLTLTVGEGNGAVKVAANNGTIVQKWPFAVAKQIS